MPRILVLTLSFGSGHVQASKAIARELKRIAPRADIRVVDALEGCRVWFRGVYVWPYWIMIRHFPNLWARLFERRLRKMKRSTAPAVIFRRGCSQVFNKIREFQPAAIVAVEVAAGEMAALARQKGITEARLVSVITDHEAEPAWANDKVDAYAVADNHVRNHLLRWGAKGSRIEVTGIAVDQSFTDVSQPSRKSESSPLVLLMGGGMGPTRMDQVVARLIESAVPMRIIAVAGHDRRTLRKLVRLTGTPPVSLEVVEWTNEVATLMKAATLIITKPGGVTITEAALCGLPVVLFDPIPGPEQSNAARLAEAGAAVITSGSQDTAAAVIELLRDERARRAIAVKARQFVKPNAAANIAEIVLRHALHENHFAKTMKAGTGR